MATRKIIHIDESLCNGCGECVTGCAEGALRIIDGKAKLVKEDFCDGLGDCIGTCPTGALTIEEREVPDYDPEATRAHVVNTRGAEGLAEFNSTAARHQEHPSPCAGGCPSGLRQWPVQLHLVPPGAPFFKNRELCVLSTCAPVAMPDAQWRFVRNRGVVMACPKLDRLDGYVEKLTAILNEPSIPRAVVVRMEVPCCSGLSRLALEAARRTGRDDLQVVEATVSADGRFLGERVLHGPAD